LEFCNDGRAQKTRMMPDGWTDGQTDRQTDGETDRKTDRQTDGRAVRQNWSSNIALCMHAGAR